MARYLKDKGKEVHVTRGRDNEAMATPAGITGLRGLIGNLNWATRERMPQGAGEASILASTLPNPKVQDLREANAAYRRLLATADTPVPIRPIPLKRLVLVTFTDSSLANAGGGLSQICYMVCAADCSIRDGAFADISCLTFRSHKNKKAGSVTLLVEANGMSEGLAETEWVASWIGIAKDFSYDLRKRHLRNREIKVTTVMREPECLKSELAVTDAKSIYDNLNREQ